MCAVVGMILLYPLTWLGHLMCTQASTIHCNGTRVGKCIITPTYMHLWLCVQVEKLTAHEGRGGLLVEGEGFGGHLQNCSMVNPFH